MLFHKNIWQKCVQAFPEIAENSFLSVRPECNGEGFCFVSLSCVPFVFFFETEVHHSNKRFKRKSSTTTQCEAH